MKCARLSSKLKCRCRFCLPFSRLMKFSGMRETELSCSSFLSHRTCKVWRNVFARLLSSSHVWLNRLLNMRNDDDDEEGIQKQAKSHHQRALENSTCLLNNLGKTSQFALTRHSADYPSLARHHRCPCALNVCLLSMGLLESRAAKFHRSSALALAFYSERTSARKSLLKSVRLCDSVFGFHVARRALQNGEGEMFS